LFILGCISYFLLCVRLSSVVKPVVLIKRGLDLISITVPPTLPISMIIGIVYAVEKLKKKNIFTISPNQIIEGGLL
jgi:cation-transporting ATPase 13A2